MATLGIAISERETFGLYHHQPCRLEMAETAETVETFATFETCAMAETFAMAVICEMLETLGISHLLAMAETFEIESREIELNATDWTGSIGWIECHAIALIGLCLIDRRLTGSTLCFEIEIGIEIAAGAEVVAVVVLLIRIVPATARDRDRHHDAAVVPDSDSAPVHAIVLPSDDHHSTLPTCAAAPGLAPTDASDLVVRCDEVIYTGVHHRVVDGRRHHRLHPACSHETHRDGTVPTHLRFDPSGRVGQDRRAVSIPLSGRMYRGRLLSERPSRPLLGWMLVVLEGLEVLMLDV